MDKKLRVKLTKSAIGFAKQQKDTLKSLGLTRINQVKEIKDNPQIRGMLVKVRHLVEVTGEAVSSGAEVANKKVSEKVDELKQQVENTPPNSSSPHKTEAKTEAKEAKGQAKGKQKTKQKTKQKRPQALSKKPSQPPRKPTPDNLWNCIA